MLATDFGASYAGDNLTHSTLDSGPTVVGTPYHRPPDDLLDIYSRSTAEYCWIETAGSCGNYALVDTGEEQLTVVTAPAFNGGYVVDTADELHVTTTFDDALAHVDRTELTVDPDRLLHYISRDLEERSPFTTVFEDVYRLPPGTILRGNGDRWTLRSYLDMSSQTREFVDVQADICAALENQDVVLGLSGGVDSTAFALMFQEYDVSFRTITFDFGPGYGNAAEMSRRVTEEFGIDHEIIEHPRPLTESGADHIEARMRRDIIKPYTPTHTLGPSAASSDAVFVYGQNADNFSKLKMTDQRNYRRLRTRTPRQVAGQLLRALANVQYTGAYLENDAVRWAYARLAPSMYTMTNRLTEAVHGETFPGPKNNLAYYKDDGSYAFDSSDYGIFSGLLSSGRPNVERTELQFDAIELPPEILADLRASYSPDHIRAELREFDAVDDSRTNLDAAKRLMYFMNGQNAQKQQETFLTPGGNRVEVPLSWGPSLSYFLSNDHGLGRTLYPKKEMYQYVERHLGEPFFEFMSDIEMGTWEKPAKSPLLYRNRYLFDPSHSNLLGWVDGVAEANLIDLYNWIRETVEVNQFDSYAQLYMPARILNLELVLESAYKD